MFLGTSIPVTVSALYGNDLKNKLRRDVLTISQQTLTAAQKAQVQANLGVPSQAEVDALNSNYLTITPGTGVTITSSPSVKYPKQIVGIVDINKSSGSWTTGWHENVAQLTSDFPENDLTFPAFTGSGAGAFVRIMTTGEIRVNPTASTNRVVGIIVY